MFYPFGHSLPTLACLVTKQCLPMVFGRQTFPVCPGPNGHVFTTHSVNSFPAKSRRILVYKQIGVKFEEMLLF